MIERFPMDMVAGLLLIWLAVAHYMYALSAQGRHSYMVPVLWSRWACRFSQFAGITSQLAWLVGAYV